MGYWIWLTPNDMKDLFVVRLAERQQVWFEEISSSLGAESSVGPPEE
jgi:hypothetical protein